MSSFRVTVEFEAVDDAVKLMATLHSLGYDCALVRETEPAPSFSDMDDKARKLYIRTCLLKDYGHLLRKR